MRADGPESMRCPDCGALNPASADWCGQCLKRFTAPAAVETAPEPDLLRAAVSTLEAPSVEQTSAATPTIRPPDELVGETRGAFKVGEEGVNWICAACETENSMHEERCSVCGTALVNMLRPPGKEKPQRDPQRTALISLVFPGAGHAYIGQWGQAVARSLLQTWVVAAALIGGAQGSVGLAAVFGLAAFVLWLLAGYDSYQEASGQSAAVILEGRRLLWTVLGLLAMLIMIVGIAAVRTPTIN